MTNVVVFLDALTPRELTGSLKDWHQGEMHSGVPRVTPRVMSSIYTGLDPAENGMLEVSKFGGRDTTRPRKSTFIDQAVRQGMSVLCMGMPFCIPFQSRNRGSILNGDALQGASQTVPQQAASLVDVLPPAADMIGEHPDTVFSSFLDQTYTYFKQAKETIRRVDPDVAFIGYRLIDSYCHFQHTESRSGKPYRVHLIDHVQALLSEIAAQIDGDLMFFSDHGQTELTTVFRINRWLRDAGWLKYKVDYGFIDTLEDYTEGEQHPVDVRVENQFTLGRPGVRLLEDSQVVCDDPFDSCLTFLVDREELDVEGLRDDLMSTGCFDSVDYKWEIYDDDAEFYEHVPDVIPDRAEGVFVSGNLHRDPIGMGYYRTGVHDHTACYGATAGLDAPRGGLSPEGMYDIITDFIGLEEVEAPFTAEQIQSFTAEELRRGRELIGGVIG